MMHGFFTHKSSGYQVVDVAIGFICGDCIWIQTLTLSQRAED